jgi:hypothetical protein
MKKVLCSLFLCLLFLLQYSVPALACGDKFLVKNGGVRKAKLFSCARSGAILLYRNSDNKATEKALDKEFERVLDNAGQDVRIVDNRKDLESALKSNAFDVILVGYGDAPSVEKLLREAGKESKIIPVVNNDNQQEIDSAKAQYGDVMRTDDRTSTKVLLVGEALLHIQKKPVS